MARVGDTMKRSPAPARGGAWARAPHRPSSALGTWVTGTCAAAREGLLVWNGVLWGPGETRLGLIQLRFAIAELGLQIQGGAGAQLGIITHTQRARAGAGAAVHRGVGRGWGTETANFFSLQKEHIPEQDAF